MFNLWQFMFNKKKIDVTMKKTYIIPTVQTVIINQRQHLLAGSDLVGIGDPGSANEAELRRRGHLWDDEDEDEEYEDY